MKQTYTEQVRQKGYSSFASILAGTMATVPMTLFLLAIHRFLPRWQRYALPPEEVTKELAQRTHLERYLNKPRLLAISLVSHFGYGATMGGLYGLLSGLIHLPALLKGTLFGIAIWAASYLGWMPLVHISAEAPREPLQRNLMMIVAHIIWGSVTGVLAKWLA